MFDYLIYLFSKFFLLFNNENNEFTLFLKENKKILEKYKLYNLVKEKNSDQFITFLEKEINLIDIQMDVSADFNLDDIEKKTILLDLIEKVKTLT